jgi:NADH-quinone oxidoreductase subunit G
MAKIHVDGRSYDVDPRTNLLQACRSLGLDLPYFCWHPALGSVGACRQCAVKQFRDAHDARGRLVMACMTPAAEGTRIAIDDAEARAFRASIIEWLMVNHPHDCPVCDEGGECHLQDMTLMTGHVYRRYRFRKRTYRNQDLGPFINHEMNRCIQCYRCVRFYRDYAGGRDLDAFASRDRVYFGRHADGALENEFSGNLVEVCPTGVFTDKTLKPHYTRKWDLQTAPSVCVRCGLGCNVIPGERYGTLRRIVNRYNGAVNGYFLCDRGRFGYAFVNGPRRLRQPLRRLPGSAMATPAERHEALRSIAAWLAAARGVVGIGSPRASLEANFALRSLVGPERFCTGMAAREHRLLSSILESLRRGPARSPSLHEVERCDAVLVLGEDVINVAPRLALALRQSVRQRPLRLAERLRIPLWHDAAVRDAISQESGPLFVATPAATHLDEVATQAYRAAPDDLARLGFAIAHALDPAAAAVPDLSSAARALAERIASALRAAQRPLVVSGISLGHAGIVQAAANVAWALCGHGLPAALCYTVPECNSLGLALLGDTSLEAAFQAAHAGAVDIAVVLENDLFRRADAGAVTAFLERCRRLIVIDHLAHATAARADVALPAGTFAEADGTLVNNEGRAQRFFQVFAPGAEIQESWRWLRDIMIAAGRDEMKAWRGLDDVIAALASALPVFARLPEVAPAADFRLVDQKIPRQPPRYSGRTAMLAHLSVQEPKPPDDPDTPLAFSMEGYPGPPPAPLIPFFWAPGWNSWQQSLAKFQSEVGGPLRGDPGLRLIEPAEDGPVEYFTAVPAAFRRRPHEWLLVPRFHIFGSEELSALSPAVAERLPRSYLALHPDDAAGLLLGPDAMVRLTIGAAAHRLPVRLDAGLPSGLPDGPWLVLPAWGRLQRGG